MRYILMSRNSIDGFLAGVFQFPPGLYYRNAEDGRHIMTNHLHEAKAFVSEQDARDYGQATYGLKFFNESWMVLCVHDENIQASKNIHDRIKEHHQKLMTQASDLIRMKALNVN